MPSFSFAEHKVRLALGTAFLALGASLVAIFPGQKIVAVSILFVGAAFTVSGLMTVSRRGVIVHAHWSQERILRAMRAAPPDAVIQILQTWIPEEDFADHLLRMYRDGQKRFALRVMLMDPTPQGRDDVLAARVKLRRIERSKAASNITESAERLLRLKRQLEAASPGTTAPENRIENVDVRINFYDFLPFGPIYKIGEEVMFVGFYLNHASSIAGPMLEVRRKSSRKIWQDFDQNLHYGWEMSKPYSPMNAGQAHA